MSEYTDKTNNEILLDIKQMEIDWKGLKEKMLKDWDRLMLMEKEYEKANKEITTRLKGVL